MIEPAIHYGLPPDSLDARYRKSTLLGGGAQVGGFLLWERAYTLWPQGDGVD